MDMDQVAALDLKNSTIALHLKDKRSSSKKIIFLLSFMSSVPVFIIFLILFSLYIRYDGNGYVSRQEHRPQFQAIPEAARVSTMEVSRVDGRVEALDEFFKKYDSPLVGHAKTIIDEADSHKIDYRLLPAIAMQESTLCKKIIKDSYNCWGFGIYGGKVKRFNDFDHAIRVITETLSKKYVQKGFESPEEIVRKYTPSDTGKWSTVVNLIMTRLKNDI